MTTNFGFFCKGEEADNPPSRKIEGNRIWSSRIPGEQASIPCCNPGDLPAKGDDVPEGLLYSAELPFLVAWCIDTTRFCLFAILPGSCPFARFNPDNRENDHENR